MYRTKSISIEIAQPYASRADFCKVFADNLENSHLVSFLLTADETKAETSFVSALEECVEANAVFRDWARSWARRTIIQNAVRMLQPRRYPHVSRPVRSAPVSCRFGRTPQANATIASILGLEDFERFVFVLSVLCKYSDQDCSVLLNCSRQDIREVRPLALRNVAGSERVRGGHRMGDQGCCSPALGRPEWGSLM